MPSENTQENLLHATERLDQLAHMSLARINVGLSPVSLARAPPRLPRRGPTAVPRRPRAAPPRPDQENKARGARGVPARAAPPPPPRGGGRGPGEEGLGPQAGPG